MTSTSGMALPSLFVEFRGLWSGEPGVPDRFRPVAGGAGRSTEDLGHVGAQVVLPAGGDEGEELADVGGVVGRDPHADRGRGRREGPRRRPDTGAPGRQLCADAPAGLPGGANDEDFGHGSPSDGTKTIVLAI